MVIDADESVGHDGRSSGGVVVEFRLVPCAFERQDQAPISRLRILLSDGQDGNEYEEIADTACHTTSPLQTDIELEWVLREICSHDLAGQGNGQSISAARLPRNFLQRRKQAIHFFEGVVVHQADAKKPAGFLDIEMLGEIQGVIVAVPGEEAAFA